jgi:uncharacterized protein YdbL (DUF1318 family)
MRNAARWVALVGTFLLALAAAPALAADLDAAKDAGQVGERADGYVGLVDASAPDEVKALVKRVNEGRRAKYREIARKRDVPLEAVAVQAGAKLIERAQPGHYVMDASETWKRK